MELKQKINKIKELNYKLEDLAVTIESQASLINTLNDITHHDLYSSTFSLELLHEFKLKFTTYQNLNAGIQDYIIQVEKNANEITELSNEIHQLLRSEAVQNIINAQHDVMEATTNETEA